MIKNIFYEIRKNKINYKLKIPITYSYNNIISSIITFRKFNGIYNFGLYYYNNKQKKISEELTGLILVINLILKGK